MSSSPTSSTPTEPAARRAPSLRALLAIGALALALIVVGVLVYPSSSSTSGSSAGARVGGSVPHFSLTTLKVGGTIAVPADGGGHGVAAVLIFFASWCVPCQQEMPALAAAISEGKAGHASVLGINALDQRTAAIDFVAANKITFPVGVDSVGAVTNGVFGFPALPEVVFVSSKGIITQIHYGVTTPAELEAGVAALG